MHKLHTAVLILFATLLLQSGCRATRGLVEECRPRQWERLCLLRTSTLEALPWDYITKKMEEAVRRNWSLSTDPDTGEKRLKLSKLRESLCLYTGGVQHNVTLVVLPFEYYSAPGLLSAIGCIIDGRLLFVELAYGDGVMYPDGIQLWWHPELRRYRLFCASRGPVYCASGGIGVSVYDIDPAEMTMTPLLDAVGPESVTGPRCPFQLNVRPAGARAMRAKMRFAQPDALQAYEKTRVRIKASIIHLESLTPSAAAVMFLDPSVGSSQDPGLGHHVIPKEGRYDPEDVILEFGGPVTEFW